MKALTIEINNEFKSVAPTSKRGETLLINFLDGVVDAIELLSDTYKEILSIKTLATIV